MKSKISLFMAIVLIVFATTQCKKKKADEEPAEETPATQTSPPLTTIAEVFTVAGTPTQAYTVSATAATTLDVNGVKVEIPANSFVTPSSGTVSGVVQVNVRTILTKSQIILSGAGGGTTNSRLITTKGCVKVTASQNTQSLRLAPTTTVHVKVPEGPSFPSSATKKFYVNKISASDSTLVWALGDDTNDIPASMDTSSATFQHNASLDTLMWLNVGAVWDSVTTNKSPVIVKVDGMFNKTNCAVYISINGSLTIGALTDMGSGIFRISNIPNGRGAFIIAVGIINGQYYSGIQSILTGASPYNLSTNTTTLAQLKTDLMALP
jgi:hypothetical protein